MSDDSGEKKADVDAYRTITLRLSGGTVSNRFRCSFHGSK